MQNSRMRDSRIRQYARGERGFDARQYVTYYAKQSQIQIWKQVFDKFDRDHDGFLAPRDLFEAMNFYKGFYMPKKKNLFTLISDYDKDQSGNIDFKQFLKMVCEKKNQEQSAEHIKGVFQEIDLDNKGHLTRQDLIDLAYQLKEDLTEQDLQTIMRKLDPKNSGQISLKAFIDFNKEKIQ